MTEPIHIHTDLAPGDRLDTDHRRTQLVRVLDGIVYVRGEDDDAVLLPGDSMLLPAGEARRVWNAGDETARVHIAYRQSGVRSVARAA
jgi:quercetin dioxygenase-like cupin family protein